MTHSNIWEVLKVQNVERQYKGIKEHPRKCTFRLKLENTGPERAIKRDVRQGDPPYPTLFISVQENVFTYLERDCWGIIVKGKIKLTPYKNYSNNFYINIAFKLLK